jgi:hypothetical protein
MRTKQMFDHKISKLTAQNQSLCVQKSTNMTTTTHNTSVGSLNQHIFCALQRIARFHQTKKWGISPSTATLPELKNMFQSLSLSFGSEGFFNFRKRFNAHNYQFWCCYK